MTRTLPPLNAMRAFEAAARHESFTKAAAELGVTQTAISRHVRVLEQQLRKPLFVRHASGLELTSDGRSLAVKLSSALDAIAIGIGEIKGERRRQILRISAQPNFALRWLIPHLPAFRARHPLIDVHVVTSHRRPEFPADDTDVAIRLGQHWTGVVADRLFGSDLFPVCSPRLITTRRPLRLPADLAHHTLLHASTAPNDWKIWLDAAAAPPLHWDAGWRFDSYALTLEAAVDGLGVALGRRAFVEHDLAAGRLVQPFALTVSVDEAWYLIFPEAVTSRPEVQAFRRWIAEEARATAHREEHNRPKERPTPLPKAQARRASPGGRD